jgi:hypothetical protein
MAEPTILGALRDPQFRRDVRQGLTDALNRGFVGGLLGGPVDIATMVMRPFGYTTEKPVGGSEWIGQKMQDAGLVSAARNPLAEFLSAVAVPSAVTKAAPALMQAETRMAENLAAPTRFRDVTRGQGGAIVYHGTPHRFERFDASKIGTGEGAQAYGHGLYFAEAPEVARGYSLLADQNITAQQYLRMYGGDRKKAEEGFLKDVKKKAFGKYTSQIANDPDILESIRGKGTVYTVDIPDEMIPKMLDWDKPLSEQSPEVQRVLRGMWLKAKKSFEGIDPNGNPTAGQVHHLYSQHRGGNTAAVAEELRASGIPGIRYLDARSRGQGGNGTSNFVVFPGEEQRVQILSRD